MGLWLIWLSLTGCQYRPLPPSEPETSPASTQSPPSASLAGSAGYLAYIGGDGNIYVTTAGLTAPIAITQDATTSPENMGFSYHRISWSPEGHLAFAGVTRTLQETQSKLYVIDSPGQPARLVAQNKAHFVIYIYWAPVPCSHEPGCRRLAYLVEVEAREIGLRLVEMAEDRVEDRLVGRGTPFYFSWAPDGRQLVWHTGGARRYNSQARLALYHVEQARLETLPQEPGLFLSPAWSPQRQEDWLGVLAEESLDQLHHFQAGQPASLIVTAQDNLIAFAWSPEGDRVAYAVRHSSDDPTYGPIHIFNLRTGQSGPITGASFQVTGFFWAPDGHKLGYLTQLSPQADWLQWRVYDLEWQQDRGYGAFTPSYQTQYVMSSFNQYAQSHRFWSPDSRYLVYADRDEHQVERIWLIDTWAEQEAPPLLVGEGTFGAWSWN